MSLLLGALSALWLGVLTSISPCPLASNIAAVSFIGRRVGQPGRVLLSGLLYTLGRSLAYIGLSLLLINSLLGSAAIASFVQHYMNQLLGPLLIIAGMLVLELLQFKMPGVSADKARQMVEQLGMAGALPLGMLFALSFCPVSAALFFASLLPLALKFNSGVLLPCAYGVGTALPVMVFAVLLAYGANYVGKLFNRLSSFELYARRVTGVIFIVVGMLYSLLYIFELNRFL